MKNALRGGACKRKREGADSSSIGESKWGFSSRQSDVEARTAQSDPCVDSRPTPVYIPAVVPHINPPGKLQNCETPTDGQQQGPVHPSKRTKVIPPPQRLNKRVPYDKTTPLTGVARREDNSGPVFMEGVDDEEVREEVQLTVSDNSLWDPSEIDYEKNRNEYAGLSDKVW